jgi:hypothetical protein
MNRKRGLEESHCSSQPQKIQIIYWTLAFLVRSDDFSRWWRSKSH